MEATDIIKKVNIKGVDYNIGFLSAETGSFLTFRLMKVFREFIASLEADEDNQQEETKEPEDFSEQLIQMLLMNISDEKEFTLIQRKALAIVSIEDFIGEKAFNRPLILANGKFSNPELKNDVSTIVALTSQALFANLAPFFTKAGLKAMMKGEEVSTR